MTPNKFKTREEWLSFVTAQSRPIFQAAGYPIPKEVRFAIGFTSSGARGKSIGECWDSKASGDKHSEIFIKPTESKPERVAGILWHELVHAAVGIKAGHKKPFKDAIKALGFEGKATQALPSELTLRTVIGPILKRAGKLPHSSLNTMVTSRKKQTTRLLKAECEECGYVVRVTKKWAELGLPYCGAVRGHGRMTCEMEDDEGEE
jgi:hypothetical protein